MINYKTEIFQSGRDSSLGRKRPVSSVRPEGLSISSDWKGRG